MKQRGTCLWRIPILRTCTGWSPSGAPCTPLGQAAGKPDVLDKMMTLYNDVFRLIEALNSYEKKMRFWSLYNLLLCFLTTTPNRGGFLKLHVLHFINEIYFYRIRVLGFPSFRRLCPTSPEERIVQLAWEAFSRFLTEQIWTIFMLDENSFKPFFCLDLSLVEA